MMVSGTALHYLNKLVITVIRSFAQDKESALAKWSRRLRRKSRSLPGRTFFGATLACDLNDHILSRIFFFGVWEPSVSAAISRILRPGDLFVDVGANVGYDTLLGSKLVGERGKVISIEPASSIYAQLEWNIERNKVTNVRAVQAAVAKEAGELTLYGGDAWNQGRTSPIAREGLHKVEIVEALPLDEILSAEERRRVRLIKIDIEGGELPVLERLTNTLDLYNEQLSILVEMSEDPTGRAEAIFRALVPERFAAFSIANDYTLKSYLETTAPVPPKSIDQLPTHQTDILFVPVFRDG